VGLGRGRGAGIVVVSFHDEHDGPRQEGEEAAASLEAVGQLLDVLGELNDGPILDEEGGDDLHEEFDGHEVGQSAVAGTVVLPDEEDGLEEFPEYLFAICMVDVGEESLEGLLPGPEGLEEYHQLGPPILDVLEHHRDLRVYVGPPHLAPIINRGDFMLQNIALEA
jgi:hypothetical protein